MRRRGTKALELFLDSAALAVPHPPKDSFLYVALMAWKLAFCAVLTTQFQEAASLDINGLRS